VGLMGGDRVPGPMDALREWFYGTGPLAWNIERLGAEEVSGVPFLTLDTGELRERWMKLYLNIHLLRSRDPRVVAVLEPFKTRLSEFNEEIVAFFDRLEEPLGGVTS